MLNELSNHGRKSRTIYDAFNEAFTMLTFAGYILGNTINCQYWNNIFYSSRIVTRMNQCKTDMFSNLFNQKTAGGCGQNLLM